MSLPPIGILAGNGSLPAEVARAVTASGGAVQVVAIDHDLDPGLKAFPIVNVTIGEIGGMLKALKQAGCRDLVIVGGVTRPDLGKLRIDMGLIANFPHALRLVFSGGDDGVLRRVVRFFEEKGFNVVSPLDLAPGLAVGAGSLTQAAPDAAGMVDILLGSSVIKALGAYDIGQAAIVANGKLIALEAAEGTDRMLARVAASGGAEGGILVKRPKPGQEMRVDLPAIGPQTVERAAAAKLAGIAVLAGQSLAAEREQLVAKAREHSIFVYGFSEGEAPARKHANANLWLKAAIQNSTPQRIDARGLSDVRLGAAALAGLGDLARQGACVISRGHILGLEPGPERAQVFARAKRFQQWGLGRFRRRTGIAVLAEEAVLDAAAIETAIAVRLNGIAHMRGHPPAPALIAQASAAGLFLATLTPAP